MEQPHDLEAEASVLGGILVDNDALTDVLDILQPADFYSGEHARVFGAMLGLRKAGQPIDVVTLSAALQDRVNDPEATVVGYLNVVPTSINTRSYGEIVKAAALRRDLIAAAGEIVTVAHDQKRGIETVLEKAQRSVLRVSDGVVRRNTQHVKDVLMDVYDDTLASYERGGDELLGIPTGLLDLDRLLEGLERGRLYYVAARPGMGKSALVSTILIHQALAGHRVALFSLEMSRKQVTRRFLAGLAKLTTAQIKKGQMNEAEWGRYGKAHGTLSQAALHVDDTAALTVPMLQAAARRLGMKQRLDVVYVDYVQLMETAGYQNDNAAMAYISRSLKKLARDENVAVVALSQLNRSVETRANKRPTLSDLRDSGALEQDGDVIMFLYRDEYYNPDTERVNVAELNIAKNRDGRTGVVDLYWDARHVTFRDLLRGNYGSNP